MVINESFHKYRPPLFVETQGWTVDAFIDPAYLHMFLVIIFIDCRTLCIYNPRILCSRQVLVGFLTVSAATSATVLVAIPWIKRPISPIVRLSLSLNTANTAFAVVVATS